MKGSEVDNYSQPCLKQGCNNAPVAIDEHWNESYCQRHRDGDEPKRFPVEIHVRTTERDTYMYAYIPNGDPERVEHFKVEALSLPLTEYIWVGRPGWWEPRVFKQA